MSNEILFENKTYNGFYMFKNGTSISWSNYETYMQFENLRKEEHKEIMKEVFSKQRDICLKETDFYFMPDYLNNNKNSINYEILTEYRQFLRDIPSKYDIYNDYINFENIKAKFNFKFLENENGSICNKQD